MEPTFKPLQSDPQAARAVFERIATEMDEFSNGLVTRIAAQGYDPAEVTWLFGQAALSMSVAMHMMGGISLETLLGQITKNWEPLKLMHAERAGVPPRGQG